MDFERKPGNSVKLKERSIKLAPFHLWSFNFRLTENYSETDIKKFISLVGALKNLATHLRLPDNYRLSRPYKLGKVTRNGLTLRAESLETGGRKFLVFIDPTSPYYADVRELVFKILPGYFRQDDQPTFRFALKGSGDKSDILDEKQMTRTDQIQGITAATPIERTIDQMLCELFPNEYLPSRIQLVEIPMLSIESHQDKFKLNKYNQKYPLATGRNQAHQILFLELEGTDMSDFMSTLHRTDFARIFSKIFELRYHPHFRDLIEQYLNKNIEEVRFINMFIDIVITRVIRSFIHLRRIQQNFRHSQNTSIAGGSQDFEGFQILPEDHIRTEDLKIFTQISYINELIHSFEQVFNFKYFPMDSKAVLYYHSIVHAKGPLRADIFSEIDTEDVDLEFVNLLFDMSIGNHNFKDGVRSSILSRIKDSEIKRKASLRLVNMILNSKYRTLTTAERNRAKAPDIEVLKYLFRYAQLLDFLDDHNSINSIIQYFLEYSRKINGKEANEIFNILVPNIGNRSKIYPELNKLINILREKAGIVSEAEMEV